MDVTKMHQEGSKKVLIRMLVALVVLGAIAGGYLLFKSNQPPYTVTQATKGEVVADFPSGLMVEKGVTILDSYSLNYGAENLTQPVVTYISGWPMYKNIAEFGTYLKNNGWTVTHEADLLLKNTFYYANKDNNDVNITLAEDAGKSLAPSSVGAPSSPLVVVTISYVKR